MNGFLLLLNLTALGYINNYSFFRLFYFLFNTSLFLPQFLYGIFCVCNFSLHSEIFFSYRSLMQYNKKNVPQSHEGHKVCYYTLCDRFVFVGRLTQKKIILRKATPCILVKARMHHLLIIQAYPHDIG